MTSEFIRRASFTLGALLIYRLGCNIPLPGINVDALSVLLQSNVSGWFGWFMAPTGINRLGILALDITPYISAAVFLQVAGIVFRPLRALQMQGDRGRQTLRRLTFGLTIVLAAFQAYGIAGGIEGIGRIVENPGSSFLISTTLTLVGGTIFLAWLSEQITAYGIGNGIALILLAGTASAIRYPIVEIVEFGRRGFLSSVGMLKALAAVVLVTGLVVFVERARRYFQVDYPKRQIGDWVFESASSALPVKLNPAGIIPVILASWLLNITIVFIGSFTTQLATGRPAYFVLYGVLIFLCTFFYAAYVFSPEDIANRLLKQGATIQSIAPGGATLAHLDFVLSRVVLIGAVYLTVICLMPDMVLVYTNLPLRFGGLSLLILICTLLDFEDQVRGYLGRSPHDRADPSTT
jgi:preprotein translocase subunit SecY